MSVYMHVNVCTMIAQNDNAQGGGGHSNKNVRFYFTVMWTIQLALASKVGSVWSVVVINF